MKKQSIYLVIEKCKYMIEVLKNDLNGEEFNDLFINHVIDYRERCLGLIYMLERYENEITTYDIEYFLDGELEKLEDKKLALEDEPLELLFLNSEIKIVEEYMEWLERIDFDYHRERLLLFDILNKVIICSGALSAIDENRNVKQIIALDSTAEHLYNREGFIIEVYQNKCLPTDKSYKTEKYIVFLND